MSLHFVVIHEMTEDYLHATELADRGLIAAIDWLEEDALAFYRKWIGEYESSARLTWKAIPALARAHRIRITGFIDGEPAQPDAKAALRAIRFVERTFPQVAAVVLIRDSDNQPERRQGLEQARQAHPKLPIAIGFAITERECWILNGFESRDEREVAALAAERQTLGFDPRLRSEELTAGADNDAQRSPKRVCQALTGNNWERMRACWLETPLDVLRLRGAENGLASYLSEIQQQLAPLIGSSATGAEG